MDDLLEAEEVHHVRHVVPQVITVPTSRRLLHGAAYSVIVLAGLTLIAMLWMIVYPPSPGTTINSVDVESEMVVAGRSLPVRIDYCKTVPGEATTNMSLVGPTQVVYLPPTQSSRPLGCDDVRVIVPVPMSIEPGAYHLEVDVVRRYSPLHLDVISARSDDFEVVVAD